MRKTIQNNQDSWQAGVKGIDRMPDGSNPVPPGSWERLEVKIEARESRKKKKRFYLLAASISSLIILLSVGSYIWNSTNGNLGNTIVKKNNNSVVPPVNINNSTNQNPVVRTNIETPVIKVKHTLAPQQKSMRQFTIQDSFNQKPVVFNSIDTSFNPQQPAMPELIVQAPVKKRYRVKHINDFADTLESTPGMTIKVKPLLQYMWPDESSGKATLDQPVKEHNINTSPGNPN